MLAAAAALRRRKARVLVQAGRGAVARVALAAMELLGLQI
jgi:hypothetical protein